MTLVLGNILAFGQGPKTNAEDSLFGKTYGYFHSKYDLEIHDRKQLEVYLLAHLAKAKREANYVEMVVVYRSRLHTAPRELQLVYADSLIWSAERVGKSTLGEAYLTKGMVLYSQKKYSSALDYYLMANNKIEATDDKYLIHKIRYNISLIKYYMSDYKEAADLLKECIIYFREEEEDRAYLQSLHFLGLCYSGMGDFTNSVQTNKFAVQEEFRLKNLDLHYCFLHSEGINHYFLGNYDSAIASLQKALPDLITHHDFANESVAYFYLAKSYMAEEGIEKALPYLLKVDSIYGKYQYLRPDLRETYEILIRYYKDKDNLDRKIHYMKRLIEVDAMLAKNYKYLVGRMYRQYNVRILLTNNEKAQGKLVNRNVIILLLVMLSALCLFVVVLFWRKYKKTRLLYLQNFNLLMEQRTLQMEQEEAIEEVIATTEIEINPEIVEGVLKRLRKFEETKKYLDKDLTLVKLSKYLNSNPNYVSKIIAHFKDKKYLEYITHLRIDYIIGILETESRYRKYSYGALAGEAGFITAKKFSQAFFDKTKTPLKFFIEEIEVRSSSQIK